MVDWAGHAGQSTASRYRTMAERQLQGVSPIYERLCLGVAGDARLIALLDGLPAPKRQPNLLLGAVRFLGGPVDSYPAFRRWVIEHWDELEATMLVRQTQTNEARRCAVLLPALAAAAGLGGAGAGAGSGSPLALLEVGASAGLCLYPDRYAYRYNDGPVIGSSPVLLDCRSTGPVPSAVPEVVWRAGLDLNPLDVRDDEDVRWLESLIWPEQSDRVQVLHEAVSLARRDPVPVERGDLLTDLPALASRAPADATLVVFHSAVLAYLTAADRRRFRDQVERLAAERPTVWLSNEGPGVVVGVAEPAGPVPFVLARDGVALATADPHGAWLSWLGS
jgi:hypothetical protein